MAGRLGDCKCGLPLPFFAAPYALWRPFEQHELCDACAFVAKPNPARCQNAIAIGFEFDVHERALGQAIRMNQCLEGDAGEVLMKRWIQEDDVERVRMVCIYRAQGIGMDDAHAIGLEEAAILVEVPQRMVVAFHSDHIGCAARECFERQRATAGEEVETSCVSDVGGDPIEQRFAHPVERRAQAERIAEANLPAPPVTSDDTKRAQASFLLHGCFMTGVHFPVVEVIL